MRCPRFRLCLSALPLLLYLWAAPARADLPASAPTSPITDHFALEGGFYWGSVSTVGQFNSGPAANGTVIPGTVLDAERDLGVTSQTYLPRIDLLFRLEQRSRVRFDFLDVRRSGEVTLDRTIQFGDQTFQASQILQSTLEWRQMDLIYTYSLLRAPHYELGAGLGMHLIEAQAIAQIPSSPQRTDYSQAGPFATVALDGTVAISQRWSCNARAQYLRLSVSNFTGLMSNLHGDVQYRWRHNLALGASYDYASNEVDVTRHDPSGFVHLQFRGPELFVRVSY